jgi:hypothetical protein
MPTRRKKYPKIAQESKVFRALGRPRGVPSPLPSNVNVSLGGEPPMSPLAEDAMNAQGIGMSVSPEDRIRSLLVELYTSQHLSEDEVARRVGLGLRLLGLRKENRDPIHKKAHYNTGVFEVIEIIDDHELDFYRGTIVKYLLRAPHTAHPQEQLQKAKYYLDRLLRRSLNGQGPDNLRAVPHDPHGR